MSKSPRKEALVRAAKARAAVTAHLNGSGEVETPDRILSVVSGLGYSAASLAQLLLRMAEQGLIERVAVKHPDFRFGYSANKAGETRTMTATTRKKHDKEIPIDVRVNEKDGSIIIRYAGLRLTLSKES